MSQIQSSKTCSKCTFQNNPQIKFCQVCGFEFDDMKPSLVSRLRSLIVCANCEFQNSLENTDCLNCGENLFEKGHKDSKVCPICEQDIISTLYDEHYKSCMLSMELMEEEKRKQLEKQKQAWKKLEEEMISCMYCKKKFLQQKISNHQKKCEKKDESIKKIQEPKGRLTALQTEVIEYMHKKCKKEHESSWKTMRDKTKRLGYKNEDLDNLQFYVENYAPIIVHIHISKHMQFFVNDTHYRSQFETNKSSGSLSRSSRVTWEDRMFDKKYSKATDFQRVKYGVVNFTNDPKGVASCKSYGNSYFLLKEHVRSRCTFTDKDSSNSNAVIGTLIYSFKVLSQLNDAELKAAIQASKALQVPSGCTVTYKEIQIHGPLQFSKDIERVYINKVEVNKDKNLLDKTYQFCEKNKLSYDFFG